MRNWLSQPGSGSTYLDLIRHNHPGTQGGADFVRPHGIEVAEANGGDVPFILHLVQNLQGREVSWIRVVLPMELRNVLRRQPNDGDSRFHTWSRSTRWVCMRSMRSNTAASTTARVASVGRKTHHFVAPMTLSGEGRDWRN